MDSSTHNEKQHIEAFKNLIPNSHFYRETMMFPANWVKEEYSEPALANAYAYAVKHLSIETFQDILNEYALKHYSHETLHTTTVVKDIDALTYDWRPANYYQDLVAHSLSTQRAIEKSYSDNLTLSQSMHKLFPTERVTEAVGMDSCAYQLGRLNALNGLYSGRYMTLQEPSLREKYSEGIKSIENDPMLHQQAIKQYELYVRDHERNSEKTAHVMQDKMRNYIIGKEDPETFQHHLSESLEAVKGDKKFEKLVGHYKEKLSDKYPGQQYISIKEIMFQDKKQLALYVAAGQLNAERHQAVVKGRDVGMGR